VDYRLYRAIDDLAARHTAFAHAVSKLETYGVVLYALATVGLWLLARPGGARRWKLASASALASCGLALLVNRVIADLWHRPRPYETHPGAYHLTGSHDPSFPSDHASASLAIAFAVVAFDTVAGLVFLGAAILLSVGRLLVGAHYPGDLLGSGLVALVSATLVVTSGRRFLEGAVRLLERATDPVFALLPRRGRAAGSTISAVDARRAVLAAAVTLTLGTLALAILLLEQTFD
jgi:undecaprenyl-diphosphatase